MARNPLTPFRSGFGTLGSTDPFLSLHREMNRLFDDVFNDRLGSAPTAGSQQNGGVMMPDIDVSETDKELKVCAELPGVSEKDIDVRLEDDVLVIRAEKKFERKDEKENYHFMERSYGTFQRALRLPGPVEPEQVQASLENGVLTVTVPRTEQQERSRRIQIGGSRSGESGGTKSKAESGAGAKGFSRS